jgi:hypothetical protein
MWLRVIFFTRNEMLEACVWRSFVLYLQFFGKFMPFLLAVHFEFGMSIATAV